ncbi:MAG TPA: S41 family peptidase [Candidatus Acidoferrum sp.]|nr:S41 family peptidase [Candidatus Acidoferrum sp.]
MIRKLLLAVAAVLFIHVAFAVPAQAQTRLLRFPSYSHGKVTFSYLGDIWVANEDGTGVQRITDNRAREINPRFSPDGKWIAFSSNREGNYDVYVVSAQGGKPKQLTFHSAEDTVVGWSPDGKKIIFTSSRGVGVFPGVLTLFEISPEGGMEQSIPTDWGSWASYSPDGSKLAFSRHPGVWSRQHYRGSYAVDLWLMDVASKKFTKLSDDDYKGNYLWPMYAPGGEIYFVSDRLPNEKGLQFGGPEAMKSVNNIWKMSDKGGAPVQVTHHTSGNLYFPSMSADGKTIVYEENFALWKLDVATGKSSEIRIDIKSDTKENDSELRTITNEAQGFSLSPSARRAAIVTHGEIFTVATDRGEIQRVTETPWREQDPQWSPDGKWIAFVSDRSGREEIYVADELGNNLKKISDADCDKSSLLWAPDSKSLLWTGSDHKLRHVDLDTGKTDVLASSDVGPIGGPQFSPDAKFVSYSKQDPLLRSHIYIKPLDGSAEHMIGSQDFLVANGAKWTPDGKKLLLLGGFGAPAMSALNRTTLQLFAISLAHLDKNPDDRDIDTEAQAQASADAGRGAGRGGNAAAPPRPDVKIEWDGLERRIRQLTNMPGSVSSVFPSPDSHTYAFIAAGGDDAGGGRGAGGGPALYAIADDGTRLTVVVQGPAPDAGGGGRGAGGGGGGGIGEVQWTRDGRNIYYMQGGGIYSVAAPAMPTGEAGAPAAGGGGRGGRGGAAGGGAAAPTASAATSSTPRRVTFTVRMQIDTVAERQQVFEEAWRVMRNRFYDPKMHGVNWDAARTKYESLLPNIADSEELHNVVMEMIGEISASHTGISGGPNPGAEQDRIQTFYPGFDLESDSSGYYKVAFVYKNGPADHDYVKVAAGNYILAVNGKDLKTSDNYWKFFNLIPGRKFDFVVNSKPQADGAWHVAVDPIAGAAQTNLEYDRWVQARKEMVDKLSNGEIGYLHIRAMDAPSLAKFERDLLDNLGKKALIIDERFNGGGGIDQELLEILNQRKQYESYVGRDSVRVPRPVQAFFGPMVVLENERSASNAEMFPEGFKTLGLGKVVGVTTYGAVIGTGAYTLLDGSSIRTPSFGVYTANGTNFENYGVPPDFYVDNTPPDFLGGHDRQIEKAVEVLRAQMK